MAAGHGGAGPDPSFGLAIRLPFEQATNKIIANDKKLIDWKIFLHPQTDVRAVEPCGWRACSRADLERWMRDLKFSRWSRPANRCRSPSFSSTAPAGTTGSNGRRMFTISFISRKLVGETDCGNYKITDDIDEAVREVRHFYSNYHSLRYSR